MEPTQNQSQESTFQTAAPSPFSTREKPKGNKGLFIILAFLLVAAIGGGWLILRGSKSNEATPEPTVEGTQTPEPQATPTPKPVDKSKVKVEIQNGTGISGEAGYLQTQLKSLGYTNLKVGNSSKQDYTVTQVTFSSSLDASLVDELTTKLNSLYKDVKITTSASLKTSDVLIMTGLRKGQTPKPSASPTVKPTATATPSATPTPTASTP